MAKYSIGGQDYNLVMTTYTMKLLEKEYGDAMELVRLYQSNRRSMDILGKMFAAMANAGRHMEGLPEDVGPEVIDNLTLKGISNLSQIIGQTMEESLHAETVGGGEADDEIHDVILEELEKQEKN